MFNRECSEQSAAARFTVIIMLSSGCHWRFWRWEGEGSEDFSQETCLMHAIVFSVGRKAVQGKRQIFRSRKEPAFVCIRRHYRKDDVFFYGFTSDETGIRSNQRRKK